MKNEQIQINTSKDINLQDKEVQSELIKKQVEEIIQDQIINNNPIKIKSLFDCPDCDQKTWDENGNKHNCQRKTLATVSSTRNLGLMKNFKTRNLGKRNAKAYKEKVIDVVKPLGFQTNGKEEDSQTKASKPQKSELEEQSSSLLVVEPKEFQKKRAEKTMKKNELVEKRMLRERK